MEISKVNKLNIGSGRKRVEGYANMDALNWDGNTDIRHNLTDIPYPFKDNRIEKIVCHEVLEHLGFRDIRPVLNEFWRILQKGGNLNIQVPDCGKMMEYYAEGLVCRCVNHKDTGKGFNADPNCQECNGKAKVSKTRWEIAFTGAQKHNFDYHNSFFIKEKMEECLREARFYKISFKEDINKIKVSCYK